MQHFLFQMILGALIFTTFAIECTLVGNRLQTTSTIMLSNIAFKLAVSNSMPRVSYFTYLVSIGGERSVVPEV